MPALSRPLQHGVSKNNLPFTTIFMSELKDSFVSSTNLLFALSNFVFINQLFFLAESLVCSLHDTLLSLRLLKWGRTAFSTL